MATFTGNKIKDTYQAILKLTDNGNLTTGLKQLTDGFGNGSPVSLSTTEANINSLSVDGTPHIDWLRGFTTVTKDGSNNVNINLGLDEPNYHVTVSGAWNLVLTDLAQGVGKSGNIIVTNTAATTFNTAGLPTAAKTPLGLEFDWVDTSGAVNIISFYVLSSTQVLLSYLGDFK
jgi:hypothetical protein